MFWQTRDKIVMVLDKDKVKQGVSANAEVDAVFSWHETAQE
jgi:hypothetical protein